MHYQKLHTELRTRLSSLSLQISAACAQGLTDLPKHAEDLACGLLRELMGYRNLRNLNADEKRDFPGLDLADDEKHIGIQVTATASLDKVKDTIQTVIKHQLYDRYPKVKMLVLTEKQRSYSQPALNSVTGSKLCFNANEDVIDFKDLLRTAVHASPVALQRSLDVLDAYERGSVAAFEAADFDPPAVTEEVELNLVEVFFPGTLHIADLLEKPRHRRDARKELFATAKTKGMRIPSDFEIFEGKLITFHNLEVSNNPFEGLFDRGTLTSVASEGFAKSDENQERVFKSLLRFSLQHQLYQRRVIWEHKAKLFVFYPLREDTYVREEQWTDKRTDSRNVVLYKVSKKDPTKGGFRHLAFQVDFIAAEGRWYMAIRPDWYFTTNPDYRISPIAADLLKGIKRLEINKSVEQHFRFLWKWLRDLADGDLLRRSAGFLSFGDAVTFDTHPALDDQRWLPRKPVEPPSEAATEYADLLSQ